MKLISSFLLFLFMTSQVWSETPFTKDAFKKSQTTNEKILLVFFADWCPTCKAQKKVLTKLERDGFLKGLTVFEVNYDDEVDFKKELKVTQQSTLVSFYGTVESGRSTGITSESDIKSFLNTSLVSLTLKDQLKLLNEAWHRKADPERVKLVEDSIQKLRDEQLAEKALKVGDTMPDFSLNDPHGKSVNLKALLKKGQVIVAFYRGSWCPYCNAQLSTYQKHLEDFKKKGASLIAITPEKPDLTVLTEEQKKLEFPILTDTNNQLATKFGLVWGVEEKLKKIYQGAGLDLEKNQGNPEWKLPVPATYIVGRNGKIKYAFLDVDFSRRAEPRDLLKALAEK